MKKLISIALLLAMCLSLFAGCGEAEPEATTAATDLASAKEYLVSMYQTAGKGEAIEITADKDVLKSVVVAAVTYTVDWSVEITSGDADSVTVGESTKANHVKLDIPLHSGKDILFTATATITDPNGATDTVSFDFKVAGVKLAGDGMTMEELVEAAYALEKDQALEGLGVLTGKVTMINTPYDEGYKNVTVTIQVGELSDKVIKCYRLKGDGAENLGVGDIITVSGTLKNYNGNIQFDAGCMLDELTKSTEPPIEGPTDPKEIVAAAYALGDNEALPYSSKLTGVITSVDTPFDAGFGNITVSITVEGCEDQPIKCYRLKGDGADTLAVGDTITVTGNLMNYNGTVEFGQGCTLDALVKGEGGETTETTEPSDVTAETDPAKIMEAAAQLATDTELPYDVTLSGKVTAIEDAYSAEYKNITVSIAVTGTRTFLKVYRMKGDGADQIAVGDTITVTGRIKNYGGTVELVNGTMTQRTAGTATDTPVTPETDPKKIVDAAYALEENQSLSYEATLSGKVTSVDDAYSADYKNITVTIQVTGRESKPIKCYRMKGDGVDQVAKGDTITVKGTLKNYGGVVEFDTGCQLVSRVSGGGTVVKPETDPAKIMEVAGKLAENEEMSYDVTLTGKVTAVNDAYNAEFGNITVTIAVNGTRSFLKVYRLKGDGADQIAVNDTLTVVGRIKNYYGEIEMVNCNLTNRVSGGGTAVKVETDAGKIVDAAYALAENTELAYDATLTGKVTAIQTAYEEKFSNISVIIAVSGKEDKPILCYRMKGDGVDKICAGDTITVEGRLKNYNGTVEFDTGCSMTDRKSGGVQAPSDPKQIVDAAFALDQNASLPYSATLTGKITEIVTEYSEQYKNITVTIEVAGTSGMKIIECYRLKGDAAATLKVGDTITVTGVLTRYYRAATDEKPELDKIEFGAGCTLG